MPKRKTICTAFLLPLTLTGWSLHCTAQKELSWVGGTVFVFGDVFEAGGTVRHRFLLRNAFTSRSRVSLSTTRIILAA